MRDYEYGYVRVERRRGRSKDTKGASSSPPQAPLRTAAVYTGGVVIMYRWYKTKYHAHFWRERKVVPLRPNQAPKRATCCLLPVPLQQLLMVLFVPACVSVPPAVILRLMYGCTFRIKAVDMISTLAWEVLDGEHVNG